MSGGGVVHTSEEQAVRLRYLTTQKTNETQRRCVIRRVRLKSMPDRCFYWSGRIWGGMY